MGFDAELDPERQLIPEKTTAHAMKKLQQVFRLKKRVELFWIMLASLRFMG
jgi:hypothetical protein